VALSAGPRNHYTVAILLHALFPCLDTMADLKFKSRTFHLKQYESVLDCLLRNGEAIPYACKAGMCQACLIRAVDCEASAESRKWIRAELQAKGYTLACQWVPDADVAAELPDVEEFSVAVRISELSPLNARVLRLRLEPEEPAMMFAYRPGQYLSLINPDGIARNYSLANDYEQDHFLELHISSTTHGVFTHWLFNEAKSGMQLHMRGPAGDCHYSNMEGDTFPLLLAGTGTGLAPLYGIARDALRQGHGGPIDLYHGGRTSAQLYYVEELRQLARDNLNFHYHPCVIEAGDDSGMTSGRLETLVASGLETATVPQTRVFLCGAPDFVYAMRKRIFLKGVRAGHIHCDPFTERNVVAA
jgi:NAD(P)H-flavin reductase